MNISTEIQEIINAEVSKKEIQLEAKYKDMFTNLKHELHSTLKEYANEAISKNIQLESVDVKCDQLKYKPIVEGIISLLGGVGIKVPLNEAYESEANTLLMEATKVIQELKDMLAIHEMIENGLSGMSKNVVESTISRFKNDPRFQNMKKEDFLKEVANYVISMKDGSPSKTIQFEAVDVDIDAELSEADKLLESSNPKEKNAYTDKFNPKGKVIINSLKKKVLDEAYSITHNQVKVSDNTTNSFGEDPVKEFMETWG